MDMEASGDEAPVIRPALAKFAQSFIGNPAPPEFARKAKSGSVAPISTHFGDIAMSLEPIQMPDGTVKPVLAGFWRKDADGSLSDPPLPVVAELLEKPLFVKAAHDALEGKKWQGFMKIAKIPPQPGDLALYQTDPDRRRSFLFNIGDGREIIVFANDDKTTLLRAALVKRGAFGSKNIASLPEDLHLALYEHETISNVLDTMIASALRAPTRSVPAPPVRQKEILMEEEEKPIAPILPRAAPSIPKSLLKGRYEREEKHEDSEGTPDIFKPVGAYPMQKRKEKKEEWEVAEEKGAKQERHAAEESHEDAYHPMKKGKPAIMPKLSQPDFDSISSISDPYLAQQKILATLQRLHKERIDADNQRSAALARLSTRLDGVDKNITALRKELVIFEEGYEKKRDEVEKALSDWSKQKAVMSELDKRMAGAKSDATTLRQELDSVQKPIAKEAEWAAALQNSLESLSEVTRRLAESEKAHQEKVAKMSEQLQKSIQKSISNAKSK